MQIPKILFLTTVAFFLTACGGGGSSGSSQVPVSEEPVDADPSGYWMEDNDSQVVALVNQDRIAVIDFEDGELFLGAYEVRESDLSSTGKSYLLNGAFQSEATVAATVVDGATISARFAMPSRDPVDVDLLYTAVTSVSPAIDDLQGAWAETSSEQNLVLTINAEGVISATDDDGCLVAGTVNLTDSGGVYAVADIEVTACAAAGNYSGLVAPVHASDDSDALVFVYANSAKGFAFYLPRSELGIVLIQGI